MSKNPWIHVCAALPPELLRQIAPASNDGVFHLGGLPGGDLFHQGQQLGADRVAGFCGFAIGDVADAWLAAATQPAQIGLVVLAAGSQQANDGPEVDSSIAAINAFVRVVEKRRALGGPATHQREFEANEPFVLVAPYGVGGTPCNKGGLRQNDSSHALNDLVLHQLNTEARNTISVSRYPGDRINGAADLDVPVGEVADVEEFHLGGLTHGVGQHLFQRHLVLAESLYRLHAIKGHAVGLPLRYGAGCAAAKLGQALSPQLFLIQPFVELHGIRLDESNPDVKKNLNRLWVICAHG